MASTEQCGAAPGTGVHSATMASMAKVSRVLAKASPPAAARGQTAEWAAKWAAK